MSGAKDGGKKSSLDDKPVMSVWCMRTSCTNSQGKANTTLLTLRKTKNNAVEGLSGYLPMDGSHQCMYSTHKLAWSMHEHSLSSGMFEIVMILVLRQA